MLRLILLILVLINANVSLCQHSQNNESQLKYFDSLIKTLNEYKETARQVSTIPNAKIFISSEAYDSIGTVKKILGQENSIMYTIGYIYRGSRKRKLKQPVYFIYCSIDENKITHIANIKDFIMEP